MDKHLDVEQKFSAGGSILGAAAMDTVGAQHSPNKITVKCFFMAAKLYQLMDLIS